ncbi:hypothetical protein HYV49_05010 [Candidatus Pacearchaeota archaeon]|nr:hypothetical protein [Candidatus Pacearchaeota archaeon]
MQEQLVRRELPIQSIIERERMGLDDLVVTVPVHPKIFNLSQEVRTDLSLLGGAKEIVKSFYEEDMAYYLKCLEIHEYDPSLIKGFERFDDNWVLDGTPDEEGFLILTWKNNGKVDCIEVVKSPVFFYNQYDESGRFYTPESALEGNLIENIGRSQRHSEVVFMSPEKMSRYGAESRLAKIDTERGIAKVMGRAFTSDYQPNMGKALLLRDFAVFYLNRLLDITHTK